MEHEQIEGAEVTPEGGYVNGYFAGFRVISAWHGKSLQDFHGELPYELEIHLEMDSESCQTGGKLAFSHDMLRCYQVEDGWRFESADMRLLPVSLHVSKDYTKQRLSIPFGTHGSGQQLRALQLFRTAVECMFPFHSTMSLHAACVELDGQAVAFTATSGMGKSTRANCWIERLGARFISGDRPAIRIVDGGAIACGVPWDGKESICRQAEVPLRAICEVRRAPFVRLRKLSYSAARKVLMAQCFMPMWDQEATIASLRTIKQLNESVPIYRMFCGPDCESAEQVYAMLFSEGGEIEIMEEMPDMKIKANFELRNVAGEYIVMPTGDNVDVYGGMLVLNDVSAYIWEQLANPISRDDLLALVLAEFDVDAETASRDLDVFLDKLREQKLLDEE